MVGPSFERLLSIASPPLLGADDAFHSGALGFGGELADELAVVLNLRNGFFAFEGALRFFPSRSVPVSCGLSEWNSRDLWRFEYNDLTNGCFFFAEDIFGGQFCLSEEEIYAFDPETGQRSVLASSFDGWASALLADYEFLTGYALAHEWQATHGKIAGRERLVPRTPFVVGGEFSLSNLAAVDSVKGMQYRGRLACRIRSLPDGAEITLPLS